MICGAPRRDGELLLEQHVFGRQATLRERALDHQQQVIGIDGLGEEVERAFLHRRHGILNAAERGHHDDRQLGIQLLGRAKHAKSVALGQAGGRTTPRLDASDAKGLDGLGLSRASMTPWPCASERGAA